MTKPRKVAATALAIVTLAVALLATFWCDLAKNSAVHGDPLPEVTDGTSILTWNLQWFPGHTSKKTSASAQAKHVDAVAKVLIEADADIVCLQEVRGKEGLDALLAKLPGYRMQVISTFAGTQEVAIISKGNAKATFAVEFAKSVNTPPRGFGFAAYDLDGHVLLIYTVHLKSNFSRGGDESAQNFAKREEAARQLLGHVGSMEELHRGQGAKSVSTVIAGDFNTSPFAAQFDSEDTFSILTGTGGFTWGFRGVLEKEAATWLSDGNFPDATFDHHYSKMGEGAEAGRSVVLPTAREVSDHRPVVMRVRMPGV